MLTTLKQTAVKEPSMYHHYIYALLATFNGMRRGEIYGLEWGDIDFENKTISIKRQRCYRPKLGLYTDTPKTAKSIRTIGLADFIVEELRAYKVLHPQNELYADKDGNQYHPNLSYSYLKNFCHKHGLHFVKPHAMRHALYLNGNGYTVSIPIFGA